MSPAADSMKSELRLADPHEPFLALFVETSHPRRDRVLVTEDTIAAKGVEFTSRSFARLCRSLGSHRRFGAVGKHDSIAVIERFIRSMKTEGTRRILLPVRLGQMRRELAATWLGTTSTGLIRGSRGSPRGSLAPRDSSCSWSRASLQVILAGMRRSPGAPLRFPLRVAALCLTQPITAQVEEAFADNPVPGLFAALLNVTLSEELTGASYRVDNGGGGVDDTRFSTFKLPWSREVEAGFGHGTLHVSASGGVLLADDGIQLATPFGEARVDEDWTVLGAQAGLGWTCPLGRGWALRPAGALALSYLENEARYNDVGLAVLAPLIDERLVNWEAWAAMGSATLTLEHPRERKRLSSGFSARYALARTWVFDATSELQEGHDTGQFAVVRAEVGAPSGWSPRGASLSWDVFGDWTGLYDIDEEALGFHEFLQLGAGLTWKVLRLPLRVSTAWITGQDIRGWSLGLSLAY
jgi:hypothetical protein